MTFSKGDRINLIINVIAGIVAVAIMGWAENLATSASSHPEYVAARLMFYFAGLLFISCYFIWTWKRRSKRWKFWGRLITALPTIIAFLSGFWWVPYRETNALLQPTPFPALIPDDKPDPINGANLCPGINLLLGGNIYGGITFPFTAVEYNHRPIILVEQDNKGGLLFSFEVFDEDHKILARVLKNNVTIYPARAQLQKRIDLHSFVLEDDQGRVQLSVDYINRRNLMIEANFFIEKNYAITLMNTQMATGRTLYVGNMICGVGSAGISIP